MGKLELVQRIAKETNMTLGDSAAALNAIVNVITEELAKGESVQIVGFGTFEVRERQARTGVNPRDTSQKVEISASKSPAFRAGKTLKQAVNAK